MHCCGSHLESTHHKEACVWHHIASGPGAVTLTLCALIKGLIDLWNAGMQAAPSTHIYCPELDIVSGLHTLVMTLSYAVQLALIPVMIQRDHLQTISVVLVQGLVCLPYMFSNSIYGSTSSSRECQAQTVS